MTKCNAHIGHFSQCENEAYEFIIVTKGRYATLGTICKDEHVQLNNKTLFELHNEDSRFKRARD